MCNEDHDELKIKIAVFRSSERDSKRRIPAY